MRKIRKLLCGIIIFSLLTSVYFSRASADDSGSGIISVGTVIDEIGMDAAVWIAEEAEKDNILKQCFGGTYYNADENAAVVFILPEYMTEAEEYIRANATYGRYQLVEGQYTYRELSSLCDALNCTLQHMRADRELGRLSNEETVLMDAMPAFSCGNGENRITVSLHVDTKEELEQCIELFKKYFGDYPQCKYVNEPLEIYGFFDKNSNLTEYDRSLCTENLTEMLREDLEERETKTVITEETEPPLNWLQNAAQDSNSAIGKGYCGMYEESLSYVVLILPEYREDAEREIKEAGWEEYIRVEDGSALYQDCESVQDKIFAKLSQLLDKMNRGDLAGEELELMNHYPCAETDVMNQQVVVKFALETGEDIERCIDLFKTQIGDFPLVSYATDYDFEIYSLYSTNIYSGRVIYRYDSSETEWYSFSIGYRAKYPYNGTLRSGFVTCGHDLPTYSIVYTQSTVNPSFELGIVRGRLYSNGTNGDASFVEITNSNFSLVSRAAYSTSSSVGPGIPISGTVSYVPLGGRIYKAGATTYLTSGLVTTEDACAYFSTDSGTILVNHLTKAQCTADHGDSGGIAYYIPPNSSGYGEAAGIVTGGSSGICFFSQYGMITTSLGAFAY